MNLGTRQADIFNAVNSIFVNGYLTTAGWGIGPTLELIERAGFEVEVEPTSPIRRARRQKRGRAEPAGRTPVRVAGRERACRGRAI